jgi:hypothetical protein
MKNDFLEEVEGDFIGMVRDNKNIPFDLRSALVESIIDIVEDIRSRNSGKTVYIKQSSSFRMIYRLWFKKHLTLEGKQIVDEIANELSMSKCTVKRIIDRLPKSYTMPQLQLDFGDDDANGI